MSAQACNEAQTIAANARQGLGDVQFPDTIYRGETRKVSFTVRRAAPGETLAPSAPATTATHQAFTLKVTGRMGARLEGEGFKIDPDTLQYRDIGISDAARWDWNVTALKAPHHHLTMTAYMVVEAPDGSTSDSVIVPSKEVDIPVKVSFQQRLADFVDGLTALSDSVKAILAALTAIIVALIAFREKVAELYASLFGKRNKTQG